MTDARQLYEAHVDFVRRVVLRLAGPGADVDDLVQEVFLVALRRLHAFEGRSAASTWLYGIAVRVVIGWRRRARLRRFLGLDDAAPPVDPSTPAGLLEKREASRLVYRILDGMSEKKRTVLILFELEGLSGEEIALALGCPAKTVWTRLFRARQEFAERLAALEGGTR